MIASKFGVATAIVGIILTLFVSQVFAQHGVVPSKEIEPGIVVFGATNHFTKLARHRVAAVSPDGKSVFCGTKKLMRFDVETGESKTLSEDTKEIRSIVYGGKDQIFVMRSDQTYASPLTVSRVQPSDGLQKKTSVEIFDANSLECIAKFSIDGPGRNGMTVSPSGKMVALQDQESIAVVDIASQEIIARAEATNQGYMGGGAFFENETCLAFQSNYVLAAIDIGTGDSLTKDDLPSIGQSAYFCASGPLGKAYVVIKPGSLTIYDSDNSKKISTITFSKNNVPSKLQFSRDEKYLAIGLWDSEISNFAVKVFEAKSGKESQKFDNLNASNLAFGGEPLMLHAFNMVNGLERLPINAKQAKTVEGRIRGSVTKAKFHPDTSDILLGSNFGWTLFDAESGAIRTRANSPYVSDAVMVGHGRFFWPANLQQNIELMRTDISSNGKINTGKSRLGTMGAISPSAVSLFQSFMSPDSSRQRYVSFGVHSLSLAHDRESFYVLLNKIVYQLVESEPGNFLYQPMKVEMIVQQHDLDGKLLEETCRISNKELGLKAGASTSSGRDAVSPKGNRIAIEGRMIDTETNETIFEGDGTYRSKFSPDGKWCLFSTRSGLQVIDAESGDQVATIAGKALAFAEFSQNAKHLVVGGPKAQDEIKVFEVGNWTSPVFRRKKTQAIRSSIGMTPNGKKIVIGLSDTRLEIWDWQKL